MKALKFFARETVAEMQARMRSRRENPEASLKRKSWTGPIGTDVSHAFLELGREDSIAVLVGNRLISVKVRADGRVSVKDEEILRLPYEKQHVNETLAERVAADRVEEMKRNGFVPDPFTGAPVKQMVADFESLARDPALVSAQAKMEFWIRDNAKAHGINMTAKTIDSIFDACRCPGCVAIYRKY